MNEFTELMATTRAIRRYVAEPIPDEDLREMLWAATRAPSGSNRQGFHFVVLTDGERAHDAKRLLGNSFRAGWAAKRQVDNYQADDRQAEQRQPRDNEPERATTPKSRMAATMQHFVDHFETTPCVVLACLRRHRPANPLEGASMYPAVQNLLLAAHALGYGGVLTQWHTDVESELKVLLGIPADVGIHAVVPLGRPAGGGHGPVRRRPMSELVSLETWGVAPGWAHDPEGTRFAQAGPPSQGMSL
jgi:nitroreductase